jgi:two-component system chemotaxis response regulator CheB
LALAKVAALKPDIITLDFEMPEMNGLDTLRALKSSGVNIPVIMISSHTQQGAAVTVQALELGAFASVAKPDCRNPAEGQDFLLGQLQPIIRSILARSLSRPSPQSPAKKAVFPRHRQPLPGLVQIVAIGISTGGPNALAAMVPQLPADLRVPVVIVQHMPKDFTRALAASLDAKSALSVVEGADGQIVRPGIVYLAPGGRQMRVGRQGEHVRLEITDDPPENHCKPAADYLFRSVAQVYKDRALGVIMTGMGADGTLGLKAMKQYGVQVIAQDEESSVVFGMPYEVISAGVADVIVPLSDIAREIVRLVN